MRKRRELDDDTYYRKLEPLLLEIARIYEAAGLEASGQDEGKPISEEEAEETSS